LAAGTVEGTIQLWDLRRIRARLREMGLDWDPPAQLSQATDDGRPVRVEVDPGELPQPERESLLLALRPFDAEAYYRRGCAYARLDKLQEALDDFQRALALKPDHAAAHYHRGLVRARQGKVEEAIADWSRTIALQPDHAEAYAMRGDAYERLNRWDEAAGDYAKLVDLRPDWPEAFNNAAWMLATHPDPRRRDAGRAVALARRAVELDPDEGDYWNTLGVAQYRAGDWPGAIRALKKAIALHGRTSYDEFFLAMSLWQRGERDAARRLYDQAVEGMKTVEPDDELRRIRAEAAERLGLSPGADRKGDHAPADQASQAEPVLPADPSAARARARLGQSGKGPKHRSGPPADAAMPNGSEAFAQP
jgi:tetratricopeptide (TPR) repeat protein